MNRDTLVSQFEELVNKIADRIRTFENANFNGKELEVTEDESETLALSSIVNALVGVSGSLRGDELAEGLRVIRGERKEVEQEEIKNEIAK